MRRKIKESDGVNSEEMFISEKACEESSKKRKNLKKRKTEIVYNEYEADLNGSENVKNKKREPKPEIVCKEYGELLNENVKNKKKKSEIVHNKNEETLNALNERKYVMNKEKKNKSGNVRNENELLSENEYMKSVEKNRKSGIICNEYEESMDERDKMKKKNKSGIVFNDYEESLNERENVKNKEKKKKTGFVCNEDEELLSEDENLKNEERKKNSGIVCNENEELSSEDESLKNKEKKRKPGIVYLSNIPKYMFVSYLREVLSSFGEVGRIYLQEDVRDVKKGKKKSKKLFARNFAEGWVEFKSKRVAKEVAVVLNNTQMGGRKKSKFYDCIWTIKYLPRFKWTHLSERLSYEQAVHKQRMHAEIYQAKREADYFSLNVDKSEMLKRKMSKGQKLENYVNAPVEIRQRETEDQILEKKILKNKKVQSQRGGKLSETEDRDDFLRSLFA